MHRRAWTMVMAAAMAAAACGSDATGIAVQITPDPIPARASRSLLGTQTQYEASWTVTVTELSGTDGTLESVVTELRNASLPLNVASGRGGSSMILASAAPLEAFARLSFPQSATLIPETPGQPISVLVRASYRDQAGQVFEATAEARVTLP